MFYFFRNKSKSFNPCGVAILFDRVRTSSSSKTFKMSSGGKASRMFVSFFGDGGGNSLETNSNDKFIKQIQVFLSHSNKFVTCGAKIVERMVQHNLLSVTYNVWNFNPNENWIGKNQNGTKKIRTFVRHNF